MKVLLAAPADQHTGLYIQRAFEQLGHQVEFFDYREMLGKTGPQLTNDLLPSLAKKADLALILKGEVFNDITLKSVHPCVLWNFDCWYCDEPLFLDRARSVDVFLSPCGGKIKEWRDQGINAFYLPEAADIKLHRPMKPVPELEADVVFIGTVASIPERDEWLAKVGEWCDKTKHTFKIWGSFPGEKSKKWHTGLRPGNTGIVGLPSDEDSGHNEVVSSSKVILDRQRNPEIRGAISARIFRTMAAKGLVLAKNGPYLEGIFQRGWHLLTYDDDEDCLKQLELALGQENIQHPYVKDFKTSSSSSMVNIARHGYESVVSRHTWQIRVKQLLEIVKV